MPDDHAIEPTDAERGALGDAIRRRLDIAEADDGRAPIVAAVVIGNEVVARGDNEVHLAGDPSRHAEIVALANAAESNPEGFGGAALVTTLQPCEMCLGALAMAGISRVVFAGGAPGRIGFAGGVMEADVLRLYAPGAQD